MTAEVDRLIPIKGVEAGCLRSTAQYSSECLALDTCLITILIFYYYK